MLKKGQSLEVWVDQAPKSFLKESGLSKLQQLGFNAASIMVERSQLGWDPYWNFDQIAQVVGRSQALCFGPIKITIWPDPDPLWLKRAEAWLESLLRQLPAGSIEAIEVDLERNWREDRVRVYTSRRMRDKYGVQWRRTALDFAGDDLVSMLLRLRAKYGVRLEGTTFGGHIESGPKSDVISYLDRAKIQVYSILKRPDMADPIPFTHRYGPGQMQRLGLTKAVTIPDLETTSELELIAGLAAWDQQWPDHTIEEAMELAFVAAQEFPLVGISYWSSKHIIGPDASQDIVNFIKKLR